MKQLFVSSLIAVALGTVLYACRPTPPPPALPPVPGEVLVGLEGAGEVSAFDVVTILSSVRGDVDLERSIPQIGVFLVRPAATVTDAVRTLSTLDGVAFAEPNHVYAIPDPVADAFDGASILVNDPNAGSAQWHHAKIFDPQAWNYSSGAGVIVAVADTGTDCTHPDIACVAGYDATTRTALSPTTNSDGHGHGTHVSSTAASIGNNGIQGAGVAWSARVMPVRVLGSDGSGSLDGIAAGIVWAVDHGADVVNLSLGGAGGSQTLQAALRYATGRDVQPVCAAGNTGNQSLSYPAAYPECVSVAATDQGDRRASFSTYGSTIDVAAPGVQINASCRGGGFCGMSGTSMASPVVAGALALLIGRGGVTAAAARSILESTANPLTGQAGMGRGRVNALAAMEAVAPVPTTAVSTAPAIATATPRPSAVAPTRTPFPGTPDPVVSPVHPSPTPVLPACEVVGVSAPGEAVAGFDVLLRCGPRP